MQEARKHTKQSYQFYDQLTQLELHRHQQRMTSIQKSKNLFLMLQDDLNALEEKEDIYIRPLPEKNYCDNGKVRVTVQVCDANFQKRVCMALIQRGYVDTEDSTAEVRLMAREHIIFTITPTPQRKHCISVTKNSERSE